MRDFILRLLVNAVALAVTAAILPGIKFGDNSLLTLLIVALIFGFVNSFIKPIIVLLTCPFVLLTLGLFIFVINGVLLLITDLIAGSNFEVDGFFTAVIGGIIMGIVSVVLEGVLGIEEKSQHRHERRTLRGD